MLYYLIIHSLTYAEPQFFGRALKTRQNGLKRSPLTRFRGISGVFRARFSELENRAFRGVSAACASSSAGSAGA